MCLFLLSTQGRYHRYGHDCTAKPLSKACGKIQKALLYISELLTSHSSCSSLLRGVRSPRAESNRAVASQIQTEAFWQPRPVPVLSPFRELKILRKKLDGLRIWTKTSVGIWLFRGGYTKSLSPVSHTTRTCVLSGVLSPCISGSCHGAITTNSAVQLYALSIHSMHCLCM